MFYIIQENLFKERHYATLIELMGRFDIDYEIVKFRPFVHTIEFKTTHKNVFCFGAVSMAAAAKNYGWVPGSMLNDNHDFNVYAPKYGNENMLNGDGFIVKYGDPIPDDIEEFFARPCKDTKIFSGSIFTKESWRDYSNNKGVEYADLKELYEADILIAPTKHIQQEVRCWVVGGKVVTASRYKLGDRISYQNYDDESFYVDFAQKMVDKYQPAEAFVLDVCLANDELKIVEVNNINSAGFYDVNMEKLIIALETKFNQVI